MTQSVGKNLKELYDLIDGIDVAMFTSGGPTATCPMATQTPATAGPMIPAWPSLLSTSTR